MILAQTIDRAKNALYSVTNRLMMQLCAKVGGEPWAIDELPFFYQCSMAVGYFVDDKQLALVGSLNQKATRYWSKGLPLEFDREDYESDECRSQ